MPDQYQDHPGPDQLRFLAAPDALRAYLYARSLRSERTRAILSPLLSFVRRQFGPRAGTATDAGTVAAPGE